MTRVLITQRIHAQPHTQLGAVVAGAEVAVARLVILFFGGELKGGVVAGAVLLLAEGFAVRHIG